MPMQFTQWYTQNPYGAVTSSSVQPEPFFRDALDKMRSGYNRTPEAMYPDGYLGTIRSRRDDKTMQYVQGSRLTQKNYQRGVHKGERIDPGDYEWPAFFNPETGLQLEAVGRKFAPSGTTNEMLVTEGKMPVPRGAGGLLTGPNSQRVDQLRRLAPSWNS